MNGFNEALAHLREWEARRIEEERRRREDRVRVIITMVSEPEPDNPADYMYLQVKASGRLRRLMEEFQSRSPSVYRDTFTEAPSNFLPQHGPQFVITEEALSEVTGYWGAQDWRDEGIQRDWIEWAMDDFIHGLSGYHALVQWA